MQCNSIPSADLELIQEHTHFLYVQKFLATLSNCERPLKRACPFLDCYCQISTRDASHWSKMKRRHLVFQSRSSKQPCHMVQICSVYCSCFILEAYVYFQQNKCNSLFFDSVVIKPTTRTRHTYAHQRANLIASNVMMYAMRKRERYFELSGWKEWTNLLFSFVCTDFSNVSIFHRQQVFGTVNIQVMTTLTHFYIRTNTIGHQPIGPVIQGKTSTSGRNIMTLRFEFMNIYRWFECARANTFLFVFTS